MNREMNKTVFAIICLLIMCLAGTSAFCGAKSTKEGNPYLGKLPSIYKAYLQEISDLHTSYRKAKTKEEKVKIKSERNAKRQELKDAIAKYNQSVPLKGTELPFKVLGDLPFTVQSVKITQVDYNSVDFMIQVKINQDIKDKKGKIAQRTNVYFAAVDADDKLIPDTDNWATNDGWVKLLAGTIYDTKGHWNSNRVQNMENFKSLIIMPKAEYKKMK